MRSRVAALLLAALGALTARSPLAAQAQSPAAPQALYLMVGLVGGPGLGDLAPYRKSLEANLLTESALGGILPLPEGADAPTAARAAGCRLALVVTLSPADSGELSATWRLFDTAEDSVVEGPGFQKPLPDLPSLATSFWIELLVDLEKRLGEARKPVALELLAPPGTRFDGAGPTRVLPGTGRILLHFEVPMELSWTAWLPGEYPEQGSLALRAGTTTLHLKPRRLALELGLLNLSFPELGLRYRLGSHWELRADLEQYYLGLHLDNSGGGSTTSLITSLPLLVPSLGTSYSPFPPDSDWRPRISADLFTRLVILPDYGLFVDPLAPLGLRLRLGLEWGLGRNLRILFDFGADVFPWTDPLLLLASGGSQGSQAVLKGPALFPGQPGWAAELPIGSLGLRIGL